MRYFKHQPLLIWTIVVIFMVILGIVGLASGSAPNTTSAQEPLPPDRGRSDVQTLIDRLPEMHSALETGQADRWAAETLSIAQIGQENYLLWSDDQKGADQWELVVQAAQELASADPADRAIYLSLNSKLASRIFSLARIVR